MNGTSDTIWREPNEKNDGFDRWHFNRHCHFFIDMYHRKIGNGATLMVRPHPHKRLSGAFLKPQPKYTNSDHQRRFGCDDYYCTLCGEKATSLKDIQDHKYEKHAY